MRTETITLGEKEYTLTELPLRKARAFREGIKAQFGALVGLLESAPDTDITNTAQMAGLLRVLSDTLLGSVDTLLDLLYQFSPTVAADKESIEENAVGSEVVDAFIAAMGLSFPFFGGERGNRLLTTIQQLGSKNSAT
jgi:hypothetical protein